MLRAHRKIKHYGLPRSGTNYYEFLVSRNLRASVDLYRFGWKHGTYPSNLNRKIVLITKNVYAWLYSIYQYAIKRPRIFHIDPEISFTEFLRIEYVWDSDLYGDESERVYLTSDNPIQHWNEMYRNWINQLSHVKKVVVRYEDLLMEPSFQLNRLCFEFKVERSTSNLVYPKDELKPGSSSNFNLLTSDVPNKRIVNYYQNLEYMSNYNIEDLSWVNSKLDKEIISQLSYSMHGVTDT